MYKYYFLILKNCIKCLFSVIYLQEVLIMDFSMYVKNKLLGLIRDMEENRECFVKNLGRIFQGKGNLLFQKPCF